MGVVVSRLQIETAQLLLISTNDVVVFHVAKDLHSAGKRCVPYRLIGFGGKLVSAKPPSHLLNDEEAKKSIDPANEGFVAFV